MRIVLAPDKFKGCLTAPQVCSAIAAGIRTILPIAEIDFCPMADGGEGTVDTLVAATSGRFETRRVCGPLPEMKVDARFGILGDGQTAVIEMSAASGLALLAPADRNPMNTTTFGTGQLLMAATEMGVGKIILGIGGSATNDGGIGCAQACGLPVILEGGEPVSPTEPLTGADVSRVVLIKHGRGSPVEKLQIQVACDVTNPLCGPNGASAIFGPQKGATVEQVRELDGALLQLARRNGKMEIADMPGAGAAGGLGFGMAAFFGAQLHPGIEIVMVAAKLRQRLKDADLCITGEGRLDGQSLNGKTAIGVAHLCREMNIPCIAIAGQIDDGIDFKSHGIAGAFSTSEIANGIEDSIARAPELISQLAGRIPQIVNWKNT
jgi:glycerate kinase